MAGCGGRWQRSAGFALLLLLVVSCQPSQPPKPTAAEQAAAAEAERNRRDLERCQRDRLAVRKQVDELRFTQRELAQLKAEAYVPTTRPTPIDPALAARFSLADQELDSVHYQQSLETWQQAERQRYSQWMQRHTSLQRRLEERQRRQLSALKALNSSLFDPAQPEQISQAAVSKYSSCDPTLF